MDIDDRLKLLKKERARRRPDPVVKTWQTIDAESGLSTKEKLERLIRLRAPGDRPKPRPEPGTATRRPSFRLVENHYHLETRYGRTRLNAGLEISGEVLGLLGRDRRFIDRSLDSALFVDLETTGLSGGAGTVPFLIGAAYYREGKFHIVQFFLEDPAAEPAMLHEFAAFVARLDFRSVVSYNGKAFDLPLLETRSILHREPLGLAGLPHLDFLFPARTLWSHKQDSCRLCQLARDMLAVEREEDIPSMEIPWRYFEYLRTRNFSLVEPILYHNQEDLLSLLGVIIAGAGVMAGGAAPAGWPEPDAMDLFGAAKVHAKTGDRERSADLFRRALDGRLTRKVELEAKLKLAAHHKKNHDWEKAAALWRELAPHRPACFRELAIYYERQQKDIQAAAAAAERGLELADGLSPSQQSDFARRLRRLRAKLPATDKGR